MEAPGFPGVPAAPLLPAPRTPAPGAPPAPAPAPSPANAADDDGYCGVCGSAHSEEGDALLFCDGPGCGVAVHQLCYGIRALPPEDEPWFCEPCHCDSVAFEAARAAVRPDAAPSPPGARAPTSLDFPRTERACAICSGGPDGPVVDAAAKIPLAFKRATTLPKADARTRDVGDAAWRTMDFLLQSRHRPMTKGLDGAPAVGERCSKFKGAKKMATTTAIDAAAPPRVAQTPAQVPLGTFFVFVCETCIVSMCMKTRWSENIMPSPHFV